MGCAGTRQSMIVENKAKNKTDNIYANTRRLTKIKTKAKFSALKQNCNSGLEVIKELPLNLEFSSKEGQIFEKINS